MLASSINFEVEFKPVTLVQLAHSRTLDCTDVHERIGLPVVAGNEAEALHGVEELDCASGFFTCQLTLRCSRFGWCCNHVTKHLQIGRRDLSAAIDEVEFQLLSFGQAFQASAFDCADVYEHIFATVFTLDEAKTFLSVEKLHHALAGADHLSRHPATAAASAATGTAEAATTAAAARAAEAAAITAAETATIAAAEAATITAAETTAITTTEATTTTAAETTVGIEIVFAETVALVASATPPSIKTHRNQ